MTTNYERIKDMTVEEMAEFLRGLNIDCTRCPRRCSCSDTCEVTLKNWLEQEYKRK